MSQKTTPKISIIIPCYNAAPCLQRCLDSVLAQTYDNWEALLINDGSTDTTAEILEDYDARDARFRVIHQQNKGLSGARNTGLRHMTGEWMTWLDADDAILPEYLATLEECTHDGSDFVIQKFWTIKEDGRKLLFRGRLASTVYSQEAFPDVGQFLADDGYRSLFLSDTIRQRQLTFHEDLVYAEDLLFHLEYLSIAQQVTTSDAVNYLYYIREDPASVHCVKGSAAQELLLYQHTRQALQQISSTLPVRTNVLTTFFYRIVSSLYVKEETLPRKERIGILRLLAIRRTEFHPTSFMQLILVNLLSIGAYTVVDSILMLRHQKRI